jgi:hypothetical protein
MRPRVLLTAFVAAALVLGMASLALAADQRVDVSVLEPGILSVEVEEAFGLGAVVPDQSTGQRHFFMQVTNTTDTGWQVFADSTDLVTFEWGEPCDERGCTPYPLQPGDTITKDNLLISGGDLSWWDHENVDVIEASTVIPGYDAGLLVEGTSQAFGRLHLNEPDPSVELLVPPDAAFGEYITTITYTIQPFTGN